MDTTSLNKKFHTALITTRRTFALGSGNKMTDYEKSNGWSAFVQDEMRKNKDRLYQCYPLSQEENPLNDLPNLPYIIRTLVKEYIVAINRERVGNCGEMARFISLYLWQHAGQEIHNIDVVTAANFDHTWVIVNRNSKSDLLKPEEWGDAWIVDPWWGDAGVFYHVSEYHEKILELLAYIKEQNEGLHEKNKLSSRELENFTSTHDQYLKDFKARTFKVRLTHRYAINPKVVQYPLNENDKRSLENYYDFSPYPFGNYNCLTRAMSEKAAHQQCFMPCLDEIKRRGYIPSIAAVEEKFLKPKIEM